MNSEDSYVKPKNYDTDVVSERKAVLKMTNQIPLPQETVPWEAHNKAHSLFGVIDLCREIMFVPPTLQ